MKNPQNIQNIIAELRRHDRAYAKGAPVITDEEYDELRQMAREQFPRHSYFKESGEALPDDSLLPVEMPGLTKIRPNSVAAWADDSQDWVYWSEKIDGISCLLHYRNGKLLNAYKKGSQTHGRKINDHIKHVNFVPMLLVPSGGFRMSNITPLSTEGDIIVRGELAVTFENFKKYSREKLGGNGYKNPRSMAAALFLPTRPDPFMLKCVDFVAYSLSFPEPMDPDYEIAQLNYYFDNVVWGSRDSLAEDIEGSLTSAIKDIKDYKHGYPCDGIVAVKTDGAELSRVAVKLHADDQLSAKTTIERIEIDVSMRNLIKPRIIIKPVEIDGFKISSLTANNMREVEQLRLGPGSIVHVVRAGDVIPHVLKTEKFKPTPSPHFKKILNCPDCGNRLTWTTTANGRKGADLICHSVSCRESKRTAVFLERANIKGLGDVQIDNLAKDASVADIIEMSPEDIGKRLNSRIVGDKIYAGIGDVLTRPLAALMYYSAIFVSDTQSLGESTLTSILTSLHNGGISDESLLATYGHATDNQIMRLLPPTQTTRLFVHRLAEFRIFYSTLAVWHNPPASSDELQGMVFCFTGFRNPDLVSLVRSGGGEYSESLTAKTTHLIYRTQPHQSKMAKAKKNGCTIMSEAELLHDISGAR